MQIKALVFDVFGTVVDWRTSIIRQVRAFGEGHGIAGDWAEFADRWREGYTSGMAHVNAGKDAWKKIDDIRHFNGNPENFQFLIFTKCKRELSPMVVNRL